MAVIYIFVIFLGIVQWVEWAVALWRWLFREPATFVSVEQFNALKAEHEKTSLGLVNALGRVDAAEKNLLGLTQIVLGQRGAVIGGGPAPAPGRPTWRGFKEQIDVANEKAWKP